MADLRASGLGGVPKGETADRPADPSIGDVFYNGTLGCLDIYTSQGWVANSAPPAIPTIGNITYSGTNKEYNNSSASVAFTPGEGGGLPNSYRATSNPGGYSATASQSPIVVEGLQSGTAYTFSVTGTNNFGTSAASINSSSITANTVPQVPGTPVAAYASNTSVTLTFTAGATGGSSITNYKYSTDGTNYTELSPAQSSSPLTITGLTAFTNYTFYIKAVNTNGESVASLVSNSVFTGPIVTGGTLASDSTYYYRTFTGTGNLVVSNTTLSVNALVIAGGGGGGGGSAGAGGGAGGVTSSTVSCSPTTYSIVIGGGGLGKSGQSGPGSGGDWGDNGSNTTALGLTAIGGGGGGGEDSTRRAGRDGGSGGGACYTSGFLPGAGTSGQGFSGGYGNTGYWGGGGGGAGAAGGNSSYGSASAGGPGGIGTSSYSSWGLATSTGHNVSGTYYYAGGGGGASQNTNRASGAGGYGGGGAGADDGNSGSGPSTGGISGTSNTGGGGGGNPEGVLRANLGNGGSGIVIVRYLKSAVGA